ncbi:hypothetical protein HDV01_006262 [Terramyces sp. JEL0728]|nr:hypothetical protein HDV01_006262 [Terramyces sp. JEL0728]
MFGVWPPNLPEEKQQELLKLAIDWATANGLIVRSAGTEMAVHAPFALFPSPFPKQGYELAHKIQPLFNILVDRVAKDKDLSESDEFTRRVYDIYKAKPSKQTIWMGIHRSDYLVHFDKQPMIKQVELNTIASSFSSLSSKTDLLHRYLANRTDFFNEFAPEHLDIKTTAFPKNESGAAIANGLAKAHFLYGSPSHGVKMIRRSLYEISQQATLEGPKNRLHIGSDEIAVTYFRAGYAPGDYPTEYEWDGRSLIEESYSIKCPNAAYHLVGSKKMQQVLAMPDMLEKFMTKEHSSLLRTSFTGLYPLDSSPEGIQAYENALKNPSKYVLKPQREGGGNNYYGQDIVDQLSKMSPKERSGFILMDLIKPPPLKNSLVRRGQLTEADVISELGIYGIWIGDCDVCLEFNVSIYIVAKDEKDYVAFDRRKVLIDKKMEFYKVLGEGKVRTMPVSQLLHPRLIYNALAARMEGFWDSPQVSENKILGGGLLVSDRGEIVFKYLEEVAGDRPDLVSLINACQALKNQEDAEQDFETAFSSESLEYNVSVYVILKDKIDAHHLDYDRNKVLIDEEYSFYKFLGDENGQVRTIPTIKLLSPGPVKEYVKAYYEGFRNTEHLSDNMVLGGTILVSNQKEVLYQFSEPLPGYQPDLNRIVNDCRALKGQATAEQDFNVAFSTDNLLSLGIDFSRIG